jgi:hypothetical protein
MSCDVGYVLKDHVKAVIQLLSHRLPTHMGQYGHFQCINTAVMMVYLLLGAQALDTTHQCDVREVRARRVNSPPSGAIAAALRDDVLSKGGPERVLFYVMITDGWVKKDEKYFPGHVFVIERLKRGSYNLYQSYINEYDLAGNVQRMGGLSVGRQRMRRLLDGLVRLGEADAWTEETTRDWAELTGVDASSFEGYGVRGVLLFCYKRVVPTACVARLKDLVKGALEELSAVRPEARGRAAFPGHTVYSHGERALTVSEMIRDLSALLTKLV